jgi:hypothetical protein
MYSLGAISGLLALAISRLSVRTAYTVAGLAVLVILIAVGLLEIAPYERQVPKNKSV